MVELWYNDKILCKYDKYNNALVGIEWRVKYFKKKYKFFNIIIKMNRYRCSDGSMVTKQYIDKNIIKAKKLYIEMFWDDNGYYFCERCEKNSCKGIASSHIISVKECQNNGMSEIGWDADNLELLGLGCHLDFENTYTNKERELWYHSKKKGLTFKEFKKLL